MTREELSKSNKKDILLLDIRTDEEIIEIPSPEGVVHMPMKKVIEEVENGQLPNDKKIVTICHSGGRCLMLNQFLNEHGYETDYLEEGIAGLNK